MDKLKFIIGINQYGIMSKIVFLLLFLTFSLPAQFEKPPDFGGWSGFHRKGQQILIPTDGLKLLVDPGRQIIVNSPQNPQKPYAPLQYGSELVDNWDFHDFTFDADANTSALWIFDDYYHTQEATGKTAIQDIAGTHNLTASAGFDWQNQFTGTDPAYQNGTALNFDGVDDYLYIPSASANDFTAGSSSFTIEIWFNLANTLGSKRIFSKQVGGSNIVYVSVENTTLVFRVVDNTGLIKQVNTTVSANTDYYVSAVCDRVSNFIYLYLNGVLISSNDISTLASIDNGTSDLYVGQQFSAYFAGKISAVRYSNKARTAQEIKESYALAKGWTWDGVGDISRSGFSQVVSGGGTVSQQVVTTSGNLYEKNVNGTISYLNENNHTVNLTDGTHTLASVRQVSNASWSGTTVLDYFFPTQENGTMQGLMEQNQPAYPYAFKFDNVDDHILTNSTLTFSGKNVLAFLWCKVTITCKYGTGWGDGGWQIQEGTYPEGGGLGIKVFLNGSTYQKRISNYTTDWIMLATYIDRDYGTIYTYANGAPVGSLSGLPDKNIYPLQNRVVNIGKVSSFYTNGFIGINGVYTYDYGQSPNHAQIIQTIYNNTKHLYQ